VVRCRMMKCGGGNSLLRIASFPEMKGLNLAAFGVYPFFQSFSDEPSHTPPLVFRDYLLFFHIVRATAADVHGTKPIFPGHDRSSSGRGA